MKRWVVTLILVAFAAGFLFAQEGDAVAAERPKKSFMQKMLSPFTAIPKLFRKGTGEPATEAIQTSTPPVTAAVAAQPLYPDTLPTVVHTGLALYASYRRRGGPHLLLDSLNIAVPLTEDDLKEIQKFAVHYFQSGERDSASEVGSPDRKKFLTRYYATDYKANDLLTREISAKAARDQPHFKGFFTTDGELVTMQYYGESHVTAPAADQLEYVYASYWDILFNRRKNYINDADQRPASRARVYRDRSKRIFRVDYLSDNRELIARGTFTYGVLDIILEQRIAFPEGGQLSQLHPDYFDLRFDRVEAGWIVKCLYDPDNRLTTLLIMEDNGTIYYRYTFGYDRIGNQSVVEAFVYDGADKLMGRYELYFDSEEELQKKITISPPGEVIEVQHFSIDMDQLQWVVDTYDPEGRHRSRIRRDL